MIQPPEGLSEGPAGPVGATSGALRAVTVDGLVPAGALGFVLPHEHMTVDNRIHHLPRPGVDPDGPLSIEAVADCRVWPHAWRSNLILDDDPAVLSDLRRYRAGGGRSLVELTPKNLGRDPERLRLMAAEAGVLVIGSTGYYVGRSHPADLAARSVDSIRDELLFDLLDAPIRSGVMGEIGFSIEPSPEEDRVLRAALEVQLRCGAPIWIHVTTLRPAPRLLRFLQGLGQPLDRIVICHVDYDLRDLAIHREMLAMGLMIEFDLFGAPFWTTRNFTHSPTDARRVEAMVELAAAGHAQRLLMSHDVGEKINLRRWGGNGYDHILTHVRDLFADLGAEAGLFDQIGVVNPARLLAWAAA